MICLLFYLFDSENNNLVGSTVAWFERQWSARSTTSLVARHHDRKCCSFCCYWQGEMVMRQNLEIRTRHWDSCNLYRVFSLFSQEYVKAKSSTYMGSVLEKSVWENYTAIRTTYDRIGVAPAGPDLAVALVRTQHRLIARNLSPHM